MNYRHQRDVVEPSVLFCYRKPRNASANCRSSGVVILKLRLLLGVT